MTYDACLAFTIILASLLLLRGVLRTLHSRYLLREGRRLSNRFDELRLERERDLDPRILALDTLDAQGLAALREDVEAYFRELDDLDEERAQWRAAIGIPRV